MGKCGGACLVLDITILYDSRHFTIIQDNIGLKWLYSNSQPIAYYDDKMKQFRMDKGLNDKERVHFGVFKKMIKNSEI